MTPGKVNEQGLDKSSALGWLSANSTRPGEKSYPGQGKWTRTGQVARCWERGLDKNWTSRAEQPEVGRTLDKPSGHPPLGITSTGEYVSLAAPVTRHLQRRWCASAQHVQKAEVTRTGQRR
eukprot:gene19433-biopygen19043